MPLTFQDIPVGAAVFLDANVLVYHCSANPLLGAPCRGLLQRTVRQEIVSYTSTHALSDVAHRLMTLEAITKNAWPAAGIAQRLRRNPVAIQGLSDFRQSIDDLAVIGIRVLSVDVAHVVAATAISQQYGLLSGDALVLAMMQAHGITNLASHDADFDRVAGITRYSPV